VVTETTPGTAAALAGLVRGAEADGLAVLPMGAGSKAGWGGTPSGADLVVRTTRLSGVVRHDPGDMIATVRAGTPLRDLQAILALSGQRLALSAGAADATVGGVLAVGEAGPLRLRHGTGRDLLLGAEFVRADGVVARSGGRVVKNVAGYDVGRLLCGSYGTLAILTEATFRLHPLPAARAFVSVHVANAGEAARLVHDLVGSRLAPSAVEVDLVGESGILCVLIEGTRAGVAERAAAASALMGGDCTIEEDEPAWWGRYPFGADDIAVKAAVPLTLLAAAIDALIGAGGPTTNVRGSAGSGVLYAGLSGSAEIEAARQGVASIRSALAGLPGRGGTCVVLFAPPHLRDGLDLWGPVAGLSLMRRVKQEFDPFGRLASGRYVGGI
jgi:glycolate oxidase FAD binding subunit